MRKTAALLCALIAFPTACAYGDMVVHPNGKIYVLGAMRKKMYECTPDGAGNIVCVDMAGKP